MSCAFKTHIYVSIDSTNGCGTLCVRPSTAKSGSCALIEFYPSDQFRKKYSDINDYNVVRNNVTLSFFGERHELIEASEMRHVLEIKSVTSEYAGDYRVDCKGSYGTTNTACLIITGFCSFLSSLSTLFILGSVLRPV